MKKEAVKKKKITSKPNTTKKKAAKKRARWQDEYFDFGFMCLKPVNESFLERLGEEFVEWCAETRDKKKLKGERRLSLECWLEQKGISDSTLDDWRKRSGRLNESIKFGKMIIGNRLEEGMMHREYPERSVMFTLHNYLKRYDKNNRYHADLKNSNDTTANPTIFNVLMKKI